MDNSIKSTLILIFVSITAIFVIYSVVNCTPQMEEFIKEATKNDIQITNNRDAVYVVLDIKESIETNGGMIYMPSDSIGVDTSSSSYVISVTLEDNEGHREICSYKCNHKDEDYYKLAKLVKNDQVIVKDNTIEFKYGEN